MNDPWCRIGADGSATLSVHVQPGASASGVAGLHGGALKLRLAAPPVDGKANAALIEFIAELLHAPRSRVELVSGAASRRKLIRVSGAQPAALDALRNRVEGG
jgi:uncharacterized protein